MNNREIIDYLKSLIKIHYEEEMQTHGYARIEFFGTPELKEKVHSRWVISFADLQPLTDEKFAQLYDVAAKESKHRFQRARPAPSVSLTGKEKVVWLDDKRVKDIGWNVDELRTYRSRYIEYLEKKGRAKKEVSETARSSLEIVKKLGDPESELPFYVRGLVVGSVQSGKTENFNAVINSAIDVGYDLIIVLSGIMEDLRVQTQRRIEKEVEGKFEEGVFIGVGGCASFGQQGYHSTVHQIVVPTSTETDFVRTIKDADFSLNTKNLLVCKKNTDVLTNLLLWLKTYLHKNKDKIAIPLLIIDDEADNASLNNLGSKGREDASTINGHIRALLGLFDKKTYLGYTATPFSNVLQDRQPAPVIKWTIKDKDKGEMKEFEQVGSLFPNDFIELLFPSPNYIGAKHFFETRLEEVKKIEPLIAAVISDHHDAFPARLKKDDGTPTLETGKGTRSATKFDPYPQHIPQSLKEAVMCFILSTGIRLSRKSAMHNSLVYQPHNTMLIHISRFITWQNDTKNLIQVFVEELHVSLNEDEIGVTGSVYGEFEKCWYKNHAYVVENIQTYLPDDYEDDFLISKTFGDIKPLLLSVVKKIEVKAINSSEHSDGTRDELNYPDPDKIKKTSDEKIYIAIGGNKLSRGFTLEGLTVNYFVRNTNFSDTLLQMGRWFGYRPGYLDCCKLFSTNEMLEKFDQTTATIEDLEQKFIEMNRDPSNTPQNFALKVLKHPGVFKITRPSILKNSEVVKGSYSDQLVQTTKFKIDKNRIGYAWTGFKKLVLSFSNDFKEIKNKKNEIEYLEYRPDKVEDLFAFLDLPNSFNDANNGVKYFDGVKNFISLCNAKDKLTDWSIVIKTTGMGKNLDLNDLGFDISINKTKREGPNINNLRWRDSLINDHIFAAGQGSANIHTGGKDLAIRLTDTVIKQVTEDFKDEWIKKYKSNNPELDTQAILDKRKKLSVPEKVYRQKMTSKEGVLVIYLMDLSLIFENSGEPIEELNALKASINTDEIPLIGYAIGIPPVGDDIGGTYLQSIYHDESEDHDDDDDYKEYQDGMEM